MSHLTKQFQESPFEGYAYAYPHKTAYRPLDPPRALRPLWEKESGARFFYLHLPFCEMRCGFCNLFTTTGAEEDLIDAYLAAVERQMESCADFAPAERFCKAAIGGGTPTILTSRRLHRLFKSIRSALGAFPEGMALSVETSPGTVTADKLECLLEHGTTRVSIGVQSFLLEETRALGRPQDPAKLRTSLELLRNAGFQVLNLDLIYGIPNQTIESWRFSLAEALVFEPDEIYLYPLYVRPLTGLEKLRRKPLDVRLEFYRSGRDFLLERGFQQVSMRLFRKPQVQQHGLDYCCQEDGMIGFGAGARSYARELHYSSEYAVGRDGVRSIIERYVESDHEAFQIAEIGCELNEEEQRRRFVIKSLLRMDGLDEERYVARFGSDLLRDLPALSLLEEESLLYRAGSRLLLSERAMELSDAIGPWLFSEATKARMKLYEFV